MRGVRFLAMAFCLLGVHAALAQSDIDELLHALDDMGRSDRSERTAPAVVRTASGREPDASACLPETEEGEFGSRSKVRADETAGRRKRFIGHVRALMGKEASPTNCYRCFRRTASSVERDGRTVTLRACFSGDVHFDLLQREMERTVADLERRFSDCGFAPVAVSGNAYLNYVDGVGGLAVFLRSGGDDLPEGTAYAMEASFSLDFLAPHRTETPSSAPALTVRRDADFSDRKTVEGMLSALARSDFVVRKVRYRRQTAGLSEGSLQTDGGVIGLDVGEARERRYEAMKFMNDFIRPCENGFGWKESVPEVSAEQARFVRLVREISGRTILPSQADLPFETLAEMRRRYHEPVRRISPPSVDWDAPVNAYRYFPHTPECVTQSPYSSTLVACFDASCTRESVWGEMCALARDLERRFAVCGFRPQEVEDGGYVNYRPDVGGIVVHLLSCQNGEEPVHLLVLHFSTRLFDWRDGSSYGDRKSEKLLRDVLTRGRRGGGSVCSECVKRRLRDYCGNLDWMKGAPARGWFDRSFDLPAYERRGEAKSAGFFSLRNDDWRAVLRPAFAERTVSCFDEVVLLEDLPLDVGGLASDTQRADSNADQRRGAVAQAFYERFMRTDRPGTEAVPDVALCEICRGSSSWRRRE